jgi:hypothetical protein
MLKALHFECIVTYTGLGGVTNNSTKVRIGYRIYSLWRCTTAADYNYRERISNGTGSFLNPAIGTALH